ncbi:MAG: glycosyltransferase [Sneathiellales bacterium]|nr:glycosyltransferase [Sneathiellales bacterium]
MKILILTYGSRGDVQPFIALGKGLQDRGHTVTIATSVRFQKVIESHNLSYGFMNDDLLAILDTQSGRKMIENTSGVFKSILEIIKVIKKIAPLQEALLADSLAAAETSEPDFILFHPKAFAAPHIAEKLDIPVMMATLFPMIVPTASRPYLGFPDLKLGGWYNKLTYAVVSRLMALMTLKHIRKFRLHCHLPPLRKFDLLRTYNGENITVLHGYSRRVIPDPEDWPANAITTGYWFLHEDADWKAPAELTAFLESGPPPVYFGFGSMAGRDPERITKIAVEALERANLRGIFATGWGGLQPKNLPDTILQINQSPHSWLFPKVSVVVHHGGAGTTAAALHAGRPSLILPFFADQPFWGKRVNEIGAGPRPVPQKKVTVASLTKALLTASQDPDILKAATEIGIQIREEDGIEKAAEIIEKAKK